jgi:hypothetical protein
VAKKNPLNIGCHWNTLKHTFVMRVPKWSSLPRQGLLELSIIAMSRTWEILSVSRVPHRRAAVYTGQLKPRKCLECDSNPRSQCFSWRRPSWIWPCSRCDRQVCCYFVNLIHVFSPIYASVLDCTSVREFRGNWRGTKTTDPNIFISWSTVQGWQQVVLQNNDEIYHEIA